MFTPDDPKARTLARYAANLVRMGSGLGHRFPANGYINDTDARVLSAIAFNPPWTNMGFHVVIEADSGAIRRYDSASGSSFMMACSTSKLPGLVVPMARYYTLQEQSTLTIGYTGDQLTAARDELLAKHVNRSIVSSLTKHETKDEQGLWRVSLSSHATMLLKYSINTPVYAWQNQVKERIIATHGDQADWRAWHQEAFNSNGFRDALWVWRDEMWVDQRPNVVDLPKYAFAWHNMCQDMKDGLLTPLARGAITPAILNNTEDFGFWNGYVLNAVLDLLGIPGVAVWSKTGDYPSIRYIPFLASEEGGALPPHQAMLVALHFRNARDENVTLIFGVNFLSPMYYNPAKKTTKEKKFLRDHFDGCVNMFRKYLMASLKDREFQEFWRG